MNGMDGLANDFEVIDISQPVNRNTACFPGDVPYSHQMTVDHQSSGVLNLCAFTMSPHVGTHADAPVHVRGNLDDSEETIGTLPLAPFVGPAVVVDVSSCTGAVQWAQVAPVLESLNPFPSRVLFKTATSLRYDVFEDAYAWLSPDLVQELARRGVVLTGLDTPSVDPVESKTLDTHHALLANQMVWLENLDLTQVTPGAYFLVALPLKFTELEASPVRAVLLKFAP